MNADEMIKIHVERLERYKQAIVDAVIKCEETDVLVSEFVSAVATFKVLVKAIQACQNG